MATHIVWELADELHAARSQPAPDTQKEKPFVDQVREAMTEINTTTRPGWRMDKP